MSHQNQLEPWRQSIREIDTKILELLAQRMDVAQKIGAYKQQNNLPIKDFRVEKQIIEKSRVQAKALGLYPALAEELMTTIIKYSVIRQDELKRESITYSQGAVQEVLIIGGAGQMGQWFAQYYESMGFSVSILDPKSEAGSVYPKISDLEKSCHNFDIILLATPMSMTEKFIQQLSVLKPRGIVIEISSLKSPVLKTLIKAAHDGLRLASIHPMFGPDTEILAGKNIIFCMAPGLHSEDILEQHFQQTTAQLIRLNLEEHDRFMSYVLGSAHLLNLLYAGILCESGEALQKLRLIGGTTFLQQIRVTSKVVAENQDLYFDIQALNDATPHLLQEFQKLLAAYQKTLANKDRNAFKSQMKKAKTFFSEANTEA